MQIKGYSTINSIVSDVLIDLYGKVDPARKLQYTRWLVRKYMDLKIHVIPDNKPIKLAVVQDPYSVVLPNDFLKFIAIGLPHNGRFYKFEEDRGMVKTTTEDCGNETQTQDERNLIAPDNHPYYHGYQYTLNEPNNRILLKGFPMLSEVILLYVSTGIEIGEETIIPQKIAELLIAWLHLERTRFDSDSTVYDKQYAEKRYEQEFNKYIKLKFNLDDMYKVLFEIRDRSYQR